MWNNHYCERNCGTRSHPDEESTLAAAILASYEIEQDDQALRGNPELFEQLRGDYPVRREFDSHSVRAIDVDTDILEKLIKLGFK